jgi:hypothetical protein
MKTTYEEVLRGSPDATAIMSVLHVLPRQELPEHRFEPDWRDHGFKRVVDTFEYMERTDKGYHLSWWCD